MTTLLEAAPNFSLVNMSSNSILAVCKSFKINTPFPPANPSAFKTKGGFKVSKNAFPASSVSAVNASYAAVGTPCFFMNILENSLLPSSSAPSFLGPMTGMCCSAASCKKKSCTPATKGASGPTMTMEMACSKTAFLTAWKSTGSMERFEAISAVPAFPGAMKSLDNLLLSTSFDAKACSRPPAPKIRMFMCCVLVGLSLVFRKVVWSKV